jgi:hypothetical protein
MLPAIALQVEKQGGIIVLALGRNLLAETPGGTALEPILKLTVLTFPATMASIASRILCITSGLVL